MGFDCGSRLLWFISYLMDIYCQADAILGRLSTDDFMKDAEPTLLITSDQVYLSSPLTYVSDFICFK